jgi:hypothetical protein
MTKRLEDILNLPNIKEVFSSVKEEPKVRVQQSEIKTEVEAKVAEQKQMITSWKDFDKIEAALPKVEGLGEKTDQEIDSYANEAYDAYKNLMDLGMNVESRYSGRIFEVASGMLRNAIDAKAVKVDKKLKMVELQLKKLKIDQGQKDDVIEADGYVVTDRNELLKQLMQEAKDLQNKDK